MQVENSPGGQVTGGLLQQSAAVVQKSPSCPSVQAAPQSVVQTDAPVASVRQQLPGQQSPSTVQPPPLVTHVVGLQTMAPVPASMPQSPLQHSLSIVQVSPSAEQLPTVGQQTSAPASSGAHTPQQQRSPNAHASPWPRQQTSSPVRPGAHVIAGNVSTQHSAVVVHASPGSVQPGAPPKQRRKPAPVVSHPVSPPPFGQQFELDPSPPQTSPAGRHESAFAQRMIVRPSAVVPAGSHAPEQHSPSDRHSSSCTRQPPRNWQRGVPEPVLSRQTVEQQEPL